MQTPFSTRRPSRWCWGALLLLCFQGAAGAATLQDFGYQHMTVNGQLPIGHRPLLLVLVNFADGKTFTNSPSYYDDLVFNLFRVPSVNGYFSAISNGRFFWSRAGMIGPLALSAPESSGAYNDENLWASNIVWRAMTDAIASGLFNFADYDANHDGHVTNDELEILAVTNNGDTGGSTRGAAGLCVRPAGSAVDWCGRLALADHASGLATKCHELSHTLGTEDLYGAAGTCKSANVTLMSCTGQYANETIFYLDPWHRMQLGWCEPRIRSLTAGGIETINAAQVLDPNAPIILYDPAVGTSEFFMLEYRTHLSPGGPGYDANVASDGLAVWHVQQNTSHDATVVLRVDAGPVPAQNRWRWCQKCQGLHFITDTKNPIFGPCPAGGVHTGDNSTAYLVVNNTPSAPGQHGWRWCPKCQGLFYGPGQSSSHCPAGGAHDGSTSGDYSLIMNDLNSPGEHGWNWCQKCQGMFQGPSQSSSRCPAGGPHDGSASGNYAMLLDGEDRVVWLDGQPDFQRGNNTLWGSDAVTPNLRWLDGRGTLTCLHVRPFSAGDGAITVEWLSAEEIWADFNYLGQLEFGTFDSPFKTFARALSAASYGGFLHIKTGSTAETATISKHMTIGTYNGPVTIGR